jgi:hypothetical protein
MIQSNPIQSNPIQSNPIQSNPIKLYDPSLVNTCDLTLQQHNYNISRTLLFLGFLVFLFLHFWSSKTANMEEMTQKKDYKGNDKVMMIKMLKML